jgi:hypothetical protein
VFLDGPDGREHMIAPRHCGAFFGKLSDYVPSFGTLKFAQGGLDVL